MHQHCARVVSGKNRHADLVVGRARPEPLEAEVVEAAHRRRHALGQAGALGAGPEVHVGAHAGFFEDLLDHVVVLAGRDDDRLKHLGIA